MQRRTLVALASAAVTAATLSAPAFAQTGEIRIAHIYSKTGPLEAYGKQTQTGLMMGLNYATGGSMTVNGKKLVVIEKDDQGKPDLGKSLLASAYSDDKADIAVGPTSSGVALALLPVAEEYKKILLVEPAVADAITGDKWNKYIFRTGRNSSQDAISNAVAIDKAGVTVATLAQDYAFGRDGVKAFKDALKNAKLVHEEYLPTTTTDFTAGAQRLIDKLKDVPGRKVIFIIWAGAGNPFKIADMDLKRYGIEIATGGNILPAMAAYKNFPGMEGATYYYREAPTRRPASHLPQGECSLTMARADFRSVAMKKCINALSRHRDCTAAVIPAERSESRNPLVACRRARPGPRPGPFTQPNRRCIFHRGPCELRSGPCSMRWD